MESAIKPLDGLSGSCPNFYLKAHRYSDGLVFYDMGGCPFCRRLANVFRGICHILGVPKLIVSLNDFE